MNKEQIFNLLIKHYGKVMGVFLGLTFSILTILIGFLKTVFIFLCVYIGYYFGNKIDQKESIIEILDRILPLGRFK